MKRCEVFNPSTGEVLASYLLADDVADTFMARHVDVPKRKYEQRVTAVDGDGTEGTYGRA